MSDDSQKYNEVSNEILNQLFPSVPSNIKINIPAIKKTSDKEVEKFNEELKQPIIDSFIKGEDQRLSLQKPVSNWVFIIFSVQLLAFNFIIFYLIFKYLPGLNDISFSYLLDFLKYYIGAVIVEIIGFISIILKSTFSFNTKKIVENIFKK